MIFSAVKTIIRRSSDFRYILQFRPGFGEGDLHVEECWVKPLALSVRDLVTGHTAVSAQVFPPEVTKVLQEGTLREVVNTGEGHANLDLVVNSRTTSSE